jgi:hypothetical protein
MPTELTRYDAACRALANAVAIDEVKDIRDQAMAMACYARQAKNRDLEADATELRMRATRRLDEMRQAQKATVGLAKGGGGKHGRKRVAEKPTLKDAGIDKNLAHQARQLGALSEQEFEQKVAEARDAVTSAVGKVVKSITLPKEETVTVCDEVGSASTDEIARKDAEIAALRSANEKLTQDKEALQDKIKQLESALDLWTDDNSNKDAIIRDLQRENTSLRAGTVAPDISEAHRKWEEAFEAQRSIIARLETDNATLRAQVAAQPAEPHPLDIPASLDRTKQRAAS